MTAQGAAVPAPTAGATSLRRRAGWKRWLLRLVVAAIVLRILLAMSLSWLIGLGAGAAGLDARIGSSSLSLYAGRLHLEHVLLRPRGGFDDAGPSSGISFGALDADLSMRSLLTGTVRLETLTLDDLSVTMLRAADGRWPLLDALAGPKPPAPPATPPAAPPRKGPLDMRPPIEIGRIDIHPLHLDLADGPAESLHEVLFDGSLRVTDVVGDGRQGELHLRLTGRDALDVLRVDGVLQATRDNLNAGLATDVAGLRPAALASVLQGAGLRASAERLDGRVETSVSLQAGGRDHDKLSALVIADANLRADGAEVLALDRAALKLSPTATVAVSNVSVELKGLRAAVVQRADGALGVAGLDVLPRAPATQPAPAPVEPASAPATVLEAFALNDARLDYRDERHGPQASLDLELPELSFGLADGETPPGSPVAFKLHARVPGACESLALDGQVTVAPDAPAADLKLHATGLRGTALDPWLAAAGWASELRDGTLDATLTAQARRDAHGALSAGLQLRDLHLRDGADLLALNGVTVEGVALDPVAQTTSVARIDVDGPVVPVHRDAQGVLHVAGLRSVTPTPLAPSPAAAAPASAPPAAAPNSSSLALSDILWHGAELAVHDDGVEPAVDLVVHPTLHASDIAVGPGDSHGRIELDLDAPAAWQRAKLTCTLAAGADRSLAVTGQLGVHGLGARGLTGWLHGAGVELPGLDGELTADVDVALADATTELQVRDVRLTNGGAPILSVPLVRVAGLRSDGGATRLGELDVPDLDLFVGRAADGALQLGTLSLEPFAPAATTAATAAPTVTTPAPAPASVVSGPAPPSSPFALDALRIGTSAVRIHWHDASLTPPVDASLDLAASLDGLLVGAPGDPARGSLLLRVPGVVDRVQWDGTVRLAPDDAGLDGALVAEGVRLGPLAAYLPPGCTSELRGGRLALRVSTASGANSGGGRRSTLRVSDLSWRDAEGPPLLALDELAFDVPRLDAAAGVADVGEIALTGLQVQAARRPGGALAALGLVFAPPPPATAGASVGTAPPPTPATPPTAHAGSLAALPLRDLRVAKVDLELRRLLLSDESGAGGAPLTIAARFSNPEPLVVLDRSRDDLQPCRLVLHASAEPVAKSLDADVFLDAGAARPGVHVDLRAAGLRGAGLTEVMPELADRLDGSALADGAFTAKFGAELTWPRRGPLDLDMGGGLSGDVELSDVALRTAPDAEPAFALQRFAVGLVNVRPAGGAVHLGRVELSGLLARVGVSPAGTSALGVLIKSPPAPTDGATASPEAAAPAPAATPGPPPAPLLIDDLAMSGLDLQVRDDTCTPPMLLPLTDLDLEVRGLSRGMTPAPPVRFSASLRGGAVPLPRRERASSLLAGMIGAAARAVSGGDDTQVLESRRAFDELSVQGRIVPGPAPTGWLSANLSALELPAFAGPAARSGVKIGDGTLDATARVRLAGQDGADVSATLTFGYLSLSEPSDGPISSWLHLPAPLDTVLFLLKNDDGEHVIPVDFHVGPDGLGGGQIAGAAAGAMGSVIGRAVASAPLRLVGTVTDLVGVTGNEAPVAPEPAVVLAFAPGDPAPPPDAGATLASLAVRLADDDDLALVVEHEFGAGDAQRAEALGNPPPADARRLAERLSGQRAELLRQRDAQAAEARALLAVGRGSEASAASGQLASLDRALCDCETSIDDVLELLDAGAERRTVQRTRAAAVEFGQARVEAVRRQLAAAGGDDVLQRVEVRPVRFVPGAGHDGGDVSLTVKRRPKSGGFFHWLFGWIPNLFKSSPPPATAPPAAPAG